MPANATTTSRMAPNRTAPSDPTPDRKSALRTGPYNVSVGIDTNVIRYNSPAISEALRVVVMMHS